MPWRGCAIANSHKKKELNMNNKKIKINETGTLLEIIAKDFLSHFTQTVAISKYSPLASRVALACNLSCPHSNGRVNPINIEHIVHASEVMNISTQETKNGDFQIGIYAKELYARRVNAVFTDLLICKHGFAPYFVQQFESLFYKVPCCSFCEGGFVEPSESKIQEAKKWLNGESIIRPINTGSMILAAKSLGFKVVLISDGTYKISKPK